MGEPSRDVKEDMTPKDFKWKAVGSIDFYKEFNENTTLFLDINTRYVMLKVLEPHESKDKDTEQNPSKQVKQFCNRPCITPWDYTNISDRFGAGGYIRAGIIFGRGLYADRFDISGEISENFQKPLFETKRREKSY